MPKTFFTGDTHFGHTNILEYSQRPWDDIDFHDQQVITNWNSVVGPNDTVWHLGDFALGSVEKAIRIRKQLLGKIHLIKGNHEKIGQAIAAMFESFQEVLEIKVEGQRIWLSHYSHEVWPRSHHGTWHLHGHSHNSLAERPNALAFDVGIDAVAARLAGRAQGIKVEKGDTRPQDYRPLSFLEVKQLMSKKSFVPIDHHGDDRERYEQRLASRNPVNK